jgi:CRP-like cAMP-binding protein
MQFPNWLPPQLRVKGRLMRMAEGERLFDIGSRPRAMYLVLAGEVHLLRHTRAGGRVVLQRSRAGFVAEASLDQAAYHCDAVAMAPSDVFAIPLGAFRSALDNAAFRQLWIALLARELRRLRAQNERSNLRSAEERIVHYVECEGESGGISLSGTRKEWAAELGLSHEALYRALARMTAKGLITADGARIQLR